MRYIIDAILQEISQEQDSNPRKEPNYQQSGK